MVYNFGGSYAIVDAMRKRDTRKLIATAIGIGAIAGLRSMTAPAVVSWAVEQKWIRARGRSLRFLKSRRTAAIVSALAAGELVMDKLPRTPKRTELPSLVVRAVSGGFCAAVVCSSKPKLLVPGAVLGALAAVGGAFAGYAARKRLDEKVAVSDTVIAVAEDALASAGATVLLRAA